MNIYPNLPIQDNRYHRSLDQYWLCEDAHEYLAQFRFEMQSQIASLSLKGFPEIYKLICIHI